MAKQYDHDLIIIGGGSGGATVVLADSISAYPTYEKGFYYAANNAAGEIAFAA